MATTIATSIILPPKLRKISPPQQYKVGPGLPNPHICFINAIVILKVSVEVLIFIIFTKVLSLECISFHILFVNSEHSLVPKSYVYIAHLDMENFCLFNVAPYIPCAISLKNITHCIHVQMELEKNAKIV